MLPTNRKLSNTLSLMSVIFFIFNAKFISQDLHQIFINLRKFSSFYLFIYLELILTIVEKIIKT